MSDTAQSFSYPSATPSEAQSVVVQDRYTGIDFWNRPYRAPPRTTIISYAIDATALKLAGAKLTGLEGDDDSVAIQTLIDAHVALAAATGSAKARIGIDLGSCKVWLASKLYSRDAAISLRGDGIDACTIYVSSSAGGFWQHGTKATRSYQTLSMEGFTVQDGGPSSGYVGVAGYWGDPTNGTIPTCRMLNVKMYGFTQPVYLLAPPRDTNFINVTLYGQDFTVQDASGITVESELTTGNVFTTTWMNVNVFNYKIGWSFNGSGMIEGHRFTNCTNYNGWCMVQANVSKTGISGVTGYQAVIWDFYCCDWQGYGFALDLYGCRGVRVRGGFYTFNDRTTSSGTTLAAPWGARTSQAACNMMSFVRCADVLLEGIQFDVSGSGTYGDCGLVHFDAQSTNCRVKECAMFVNSTMAHGFELGDATGDLNASQPSNTLKVSMENTWEYWISGDKVADHASKQVDGPWIADNYYGYQQDSGFFLIQQQVQVTMVASTITETDGTVVDIAKASISFPLRRYKNNLFNGGTPTVVLCTENALAIISPPVQLGYYTNDHFEVIGPSSLVGTTLTVPYTATGF